MKKIFFIACSLLALAVSAQAQTKKTKVILLGCFHFDNPGLDVAKFENANILSAKRQEEVLQVVKQLKKFSPSKIFVERTVAGQGKLDSLVQQYKQGKYQLKAGEEEQIGFRLAKELNLPTITGVDYRDSDFPFDSLINSAKAANQFAFLDYIQKSIDSIQQSFNKSLQEKTISQILIQQNSKEAKGFQVSAYLEFLQAGNKDQHVGTYLSSEWWRRNMMIYENILKNLDGKEETILVIFGAGHTALLELMMQYNRNFEIIPLAEVLQ